MQTDLRHYLAHALHYSLYRGGRLRHMLDILVPLKPRLCDISTLSSVRIPRPTPPRSFVTLLASFLCMWAGQEEEVERGMLSQSHENFTGFYHLFMF